MPRASPSFQGAYVRLQGERAFLRLSGGAGDKGSDKLRKAAGPKEGRSLPWRRAQLQVKSRSHACITLAQGRARGRHTGGTPPRSCIPRKAPVWPERIRPAEPDKLLEPPAGPRSPAVSPPAPRCMLPPCPWRGQDIERSTVYTFQNGQPCRVMGESDRVTRQACILPRVLKGDIP